jgi:serine/threonine-protein kinase
MREDSSYTFNWTAWISWVLLTTVGWLVGWVLLGELWIGLALGVGQWVLIRSRLENSFWWVLASLVGWAIGHLAVINWLPVAMREWAGLPIGLTLGVAQWIVLRKLMPRSGWWIVISALGWLLAMTGVLGGSLVGAVAGAVTGVAAAFFLDISRITPSDDLEEG